MSTPSATPHPALMAIATTIDVLAIPGRLWRHRHPIAQFHKTLTAEFGFERRVLCHRLCAESLGLSLTLARLRLRKLRIRLRIFVLSTPDYLTAFLLIIYRRHSSSRGG